MSSIAAIAKMHGLDQAMAYNYADMVLRQLQSHRYSHMTHWHCVARSYFTENGYTSAAHDIEDDIEDAIAGNQSDGGIAVGLAIARAGGM